MRVPRARQTRSTLEDHRRRLIQIAPDFTEKARLANSLVPHLLQFGFRKSPEDLRCQIVESILATQDYKPFFWIDAALPYCWNDPKHWDRSQIIYQWGHLNPRNSVGDAGVVTDLCLMSARCNNHIQSSLPLADVEEYFRGSAVGTRIQEVLKRRRVLFESSQWKQLMSQLDRYKKPKLMSPSEISRLISELV